jgi:phosphatidate cytidylyltransferase
MVFVRYHTLITFLLFITGFICFVLNLNYYGNASYQIRDWVWSMITSMIFCYLGFAFVYIIYEGLFWFVMCTMCVIINDIAAYLVGTFSGKTPLIKLSPKKTWEGFLGGLVFTFIWSFLTVRYLVDIKFLVCPQTTLTLSIF